MTEDVVDEMTVIEFFGSIQSPYCYFALDRLEAMARELKLRILMRPVLPGVIRIAETYAERSNMEQTYFTHDVTRTAAFLELPYGDAQPCPVNWQTTSLWVAGPQQARVMRLYNLLHAAHLAGGEHEYQLYANLMRAIWSGATPGWDANDHLARYAEAAGLSAELIQQPDTLGGDATAYFAEDQQVMFDYGHWGVPMFAWRGEPFYGQDRLDQLHWRIETNRNS